MELLTRDRIRTLLEAAVVFVLVVLFFFFTFAMLNAFFPTGQGFLELLRPGEDVSGTADGPLASRDLRLSTGVDEFGLSEKGGFSAVLSRTERMVKSKRRDQIAWRDAEKGMTFYDSDALQTFSDSAATLSVKRDYTLNLGENSLVVLREMEQDLFTREKKAVVVLVAGDLSGEVVQAESGEHDLEVIAPGALARIPSAADSSRASRFRMVVKADNSSTLTVFEGSAKLVFEGKTIAVGPDQTLRVQPGQRPVFLKPPPGPPELISPADGMTFSYRDVPPRVSFAWNPENNVQDHHLMLARDPGFYEVIYEDTITSEKFIHGNLPPGQYYWRVRSENIDGKGDYSLARRFYMVQDQEPPSLMIDYPENLEESDEFVISGKTDPDAAVYVDGISVKVDPNGKFTHGLFLQRGYNVIVVEAVDKLGNVNYFSKTVNVGF